MASVHLTALDFTVNARIVLFNNNNDDGLWPLDVCHKYTFYIILIFCHYVHAARAPY